jgi:hypothetical protein
MSAAARAGRRTLADYVIFSGMAVNAAVIALIVWFYVL